MKKLLFIALLACALGSCDSDDESVTARVMDGGSPETDGCGWMLEVKSEIYKPVNLPDQFKVNDLNVKVEFRNLKTDYTCGFSPIVYDEIRIESIVKD